MKIDNPSGMFSGKSQTNNVAAANNWLQHAITGKNCTGVKAALSNGANANQLFDEDSALTLAVKSGSMEIVQALVAKGADINLVNKRFECAIDIAGNLKYYEIHKYLLEQRSLFKETVFDEIIVLCCEGFQHMTGETSERENLTLIAHHASRLTGTNIGELFSGRFSINYQVCLAHLLSLEDAKYDGEELDGWKAQQYLAIYIHFLLEVYIKLRVGAMNHISPDRSSQEEVENWIRNEILTNVESLRLLRDRLSICDHYFHSQSQSRNLYRSLSRNIIAKLQHVGNYKEIMIIGGYKGHTLYVSLSARVYERQNYVDIRIDNVGALSDSHNEKKEDEVVTLQPHHIGSFKLEAFAIHKEFEDYIIGLFESKLLSDSSQDKNDAEDKIYDKNGTLDSLKSLLPPLDYPYSREQCADNCVTECHKVGMLIRSRTPGQHRWILAQQIKAAADPVRAEAAKAVGDTKYWANNIVPELCEYNGNIIVWNLPFYQGFISPLLVSTISNLNPPSDRLHRMASKEILLQKKNSQRSQINQHPSLYIRGIIKEQEHFDVTNKEITDKINSYISSALMNPRSMRQDLINEYPILGLIQDMFNFKPTASLDTKKKLFGNVKKIISCEKDNLLRATLNFCFAVTLLVEVHDNPQARFNYESIEAFNAVNAFCAHSIVDNSLSELHIFSKINLAMLYFRVQQYSKALDLFLECENIVVANVEECISLLNRNHQEFDVTNFWIDVSRMIELCKGFIYIIQDKLGDGLRSFENILSSLHYRGFTQKERFQPGYSYDQKYKQVKIDDELTPQAYFGLAKINLLYYKKDEADLGRSNLAEAEYYIGFALKALSNVQNVKLLNREISTCIAKGSVLGEEGAEPDNKKVRH